MQSKRDPLSLQAVKSHQDQFEFLSKTWAQFDAKAQGVGAMAGVFIAATFSLVKDVAKSLVPFEFLVVVLIVLALVASVVASLRALLVREITEPPFGAKSADMILDVLANKHLDEEEQMLALTHEQIELWKQTNLDLKSQLTTKATMTRQAQMAVAIAAGLFAALAILHAHIQLTEKVS